MARNLVVRPLSSLRSSRNGERVIYENLNGVLAGLIVFIAEERS